MPPNQIKNFCLIVSLAIWGKLLFIEPVAATEREFQYNLIGHTDLVSTLNLTRNGHYLVSGSSDSSLRIWDLNTRREIRRINAQTIVLTTALAKNDAVIISGGMEAVGRVWDFRTGEQMRIIGGHEIEIRAVAYNKTKNLMATGSTDQKVIIWDFYTMTSLKTLTNKWPVITLDFAPNGNFLATGGWEHIVQIWDLAWKDVCKTGTGHTASVRSVKFSPDNKIIASGGEDGVIRIWNAFTAECLEIIPAHSDVITEIDFAPSGEFLVSVSFDKTIKLWDTYSWQLIKTIRSDTTKFTSVKVDINNRQFFTGSSSGLITCWLVEPINQELERLTQQKNAALAAIKTSKTDKGNTSHDQPAMLQKEVEKQYEKEIEAFKQTKQDIIKKSTKPISLPVSKVGKYDNTNNTLELVIKEIIVTIKIPPIQAQSLISNWYKTKANGYCSLTNNLLRFTYTFSEIENPVVGEKYKIIKQTILK